MIIIRNQDCLVTGSLGWVQSDNLCFGNRGTAYISIGLITVNRHFTAVITMSLYKLYRGLSMSNVLTSEAFTLYSVMDF